MHSNDFSRQVGPTLPSVGDRPRRHTLSPSVVAGFRHFQQSCRAGDREPLLRKAAGVGGVGNPAVDAVAAVSKWATWER